MELRFPFDNPGFRAMIGCIKQHSEGIAMHVTMILEDTLLTAHRFDAHRKENEQLAKQGRSIPAAGWHVTVQDGLTGKVHTAVWSDNEMAAVSALAHGIGEDLESPAMMTEYLYKIAEKAVEGFPSECRPIP